MDYYYVLLFHFRIRVTFNMLETSSHVDITYVKTVCVVSFVYRKLQRKPPTVILIIVGNLSLTAVEMPSLSGHRASTYPVSEGTDYSML